MSIILKRYCLDCGKIDPPEDVKCCPDSRVFWIERGAAEILNEQERARTKTFDSLLARVRVSETTPDAGSISSSTVQPEPCTCRTEPTERDGKPGLRLIQCPVCAAKR